MSDNDDAVTSIDRVDIAFLAGAVLLAVSAGVHLRLYLGGYRDIHIDDVVGVDLAGSFVLAVVAGAALSSLLVAAVIYRRGARLSAAAGVAYASGAIGAYVLTRTVGFLGFEESRWVPEAVVAKPVELVAGVVLALAIWRSPRMASNKSPATPVRTG